MNNRLTSILESKNETFLESDMHNSSHIGAGGGVNPSFLNNQFRARRINETTFVTSEQSILIQNNFI